MALIHLANLINILRDVIKIIRILRTRCVNTATAKIFDTIANYFKQAVTMGLEPTAIWLTVKYSTDWVTPP
jgi:hypothetical protein